MSSGFITEAEIEEKRRLRQLEWEKVRKPEEPLEAPPEPVDNRSLYERLKEQKDKKQEEFEEAHKLKNLVKGLDDDEVLFLDQVDQVRMEEEKRKRLEEAEELNEFRTKVSQLREKEYDKAIHQEIGLVEKLKPKSMTDNNVSIGLTRTSQYKLVSSLVKRKHSSNSSTTTSTSTQEQDTAAAVPEKKSLKEHDDSSSKPRAESTVSPPNSTSATIPSVAYKGNLVCIGVLPGLASYAGSDDEEDPCDDGCHDSDSDSDDECDESHDHEHRSVRDLCGRKIEYENKEESK